MNPIIETITLIFWFVVILLPLVVIHEFGHYLTSRLMGVKIPEFAVGFPVTKRLFYKKWKGTIWSFYPVLIGGFVRIWGDSDAIDEAYETAKIDKKLAKEDYVQNRFQEILSVGELQFFLEENNLEYSKDWQEFEKSKFAKGEDEENQEYEAKFKQLQTLIEWEFDKEINGKTAFFSKTWLQQTIIISGGVIFNFIAAIIIFWIMFSFVPLPKMPIDLETISVYRPYIEIQEETQYVKVRGIVEDGAITKSGFKVDDQIISIANKNLNEFNSQKEFTDFLQTQKDNEIQITYLSSETNETIDSNIRLQKNGDRYFLGTGTLYKDIKYQAKNPITGMQLAVVRTGQITSLSFKAIGDLVTAPFTGRLQEASQGLAGPIAVSKIGASVFALVGISGILEIMALVSISLAVFNTLPIPALDGGRFIILTINKLTGKRNKKIEGMIISVTFFALLLLSAFIAFRDVSGLLTGRFG